MSELEKRIALIESELRAPTDFFTRENIHHTLVFFGSARIKPPAESQSDMDILHEVYEGQTMKDEHEWQQLDDKSHEVYMSRYYAAAEELARRLATWSQQTFPADKQHLITTGGGPGIMEAANKGASRAGAKTLGVCITIPGEQEPNRYITPGYCLHFETFPMRKFWLTYHARALVIFPGGIGTLDEFFETYTLMKTRKATRLIPIVLFGSEYWKELINFSTLIRFNTLEAEALDFFRYCDTVEDAFAFLTSELTKTQ